VFTGCVDRFADIAFRLRGCRKVLDVGAGHGLLLAVLDELGHECYGVDFTDQTNTIRDIPQQADSFPGQQCGSGPAAFADDTFDAVTCCQCWSISPIPICR